MKVATTADAFTTLDAGCAAWARLSAGHGWCRFFAQSCHEALLPAAQAAWIAGLEGAPAHVARFAALVLAMNGLHDDAETVYQTAVQARTAAPAPAVGRVIPDLLLQISSSCDLHCRYCPRGGASGDAHMDPVIAAGVLRQVRESGFTVRLITLNQSGESLLNPAFFEILDIVRDAVAAMAPRPRVLLFTNGQHLDASCAERLLAARTIDTFIWSLDGTNASSYERMRHGASYDRVIRHLQDYLRARPAGTETVVYNMLDADCSLDESDPRFDALLAAADRVAVRFPSPRGGHDYGYYVYGPHRNRAACVWSRNQVVVDARGRMCGCSVDLRSELAYADLRRRPFADAFDTERAAFLQQLDSGRQSQAPALCRACPITDEAYVPSVGIPLGSRAREFYARNAAPLTREPVVLG
jgi:hypothetical protein